MTRYFAQNTPRAGLEHMMMSVPGFQKRGGGMMILSRFCYKPEDVDCRYCLHYRRRSCQVRTCPYIAERLKSGAIEYLDLILEYFGHIPHAGLHKRIQAVEHWSGPDQAVLHTVSVHLRSRFADRVWDDAPPGYGWNKGDTCVMITNKAKRSTSEYIVESYDGVYFGIRSHTGLYHRVSPWRMFRTKEEAIETLAEQKYGGISL